MCPATGRGFASSEEAARVLAVIEAIGRRGERVFPLKKSSLIMAAPAVVSPGSWLHYRPGVPKVICFRGAAAAAVA